MIESDEGRSTDSTPVIRIVGLNTDKTRRTLGSHPVYQVYFELSGHPPSGWREIFGREWKNLNPEQEVGIDGRFLVLHCPLQEIASVHLPALKQAVEATNVACKQYARKQVTRIRKLHRGRENKGWDHPPGYKPVEGEVVAVGRVRRKTGRETTDAVRRRGTEGMY